MIIRKIKGLVPKLALSALCVGILVGVLELYIGHRFILDPLLYGQDSGFVYESYFAPTFYGMTKSIIIGLTFFLVFYLLLRKK